MAFAGEVIQETATNQVSKKSMGLFRAIKRVFIFLGLAAEKATETDARVAHEARAAEACL